MAKYTVKHSCGHERTVQLYGPEKERERKLDWMGSEDCPQCWGEKKRAQEDQMPITITIMTNGLDKDQDGNILAEITLTGGTRPRKEEIKALGYSWGDVRGGAMNFLRASAPEKAWSRMVPLLTLMDKGSDENLKIQEDAKALDAKITFEINELDIEMARQSLADQAKKQEAQQAKDAAIAAIPKPVRPACHPREQHPDGRWNGKYYGNAKRGREYYVNGEKYSLTEEDYQACMQYREAYQAYKAQIEAL